LRQCITAIANQHIGMLIAFFHRIPSAFSMDDQNICCWRRRLVHFTARLTELFGG